MNKRFFLAATLAIAAGLAAPARAQIDGETPTRGVLDIHSGEQTHRFAIDIADEPGERARGLMFRQSMADDTGMLFIYPSDRIASFWMKNTYIPLDMLFIANDGTIMQIASQVQPLDLTPVRSDMPVRAVFEINGGLSATLGIKAGDRVTLYRYRDAE